MNRRPRAFLAELERDQAFGVDPRASRLWPAAPPHLKNDLVNGYIDAESFWAQLEGWIRLEERCEQGRAA